ncbi:MAG: methyltransferase domain-containing protein [Chloroflexi bacterium]|nr:methyltransferase domain-containing protein [Chloroflexota bacterium]
MTDLLSAALFERDDRVLAAHRKPGRPPFAGQWLLPLTVVRDDEAAEDALRRYAREQFGVALGAEQFVDTVYMEDPDGQHRYVANIFRAPIEGGPLRFNAGGDYDDARWVAAAELEGLWMPPALREPLVRIMNEPAAAPLTDWASGEAAPLAEPAASGRPAPDNRAGWDAIAAAYQARRHDREPLDLQWSRGVYEGDLHLLDDVRGKRAIVLGCGAGQDAVALAKMGAVAVGIDFSPEQLMLARRCATEHDAPNASFVEGVIEDLSRFDDESFDLAVSVHALEFVARIDQALAEAARVLKPGGVLAIAVQHPFDAAASREAPYYVERGYWAKYADRTWEFEGDVKAELRSQHRTVSQWFDAVTGAGFAIERIAEPRQDVLDPEDALDAEFARRASKIPQTLIIKARKR